jgi:hypothetical protein
LICDFCSAPHPRWSYPCRPSVTEVAGIAVHDMEPWAACDACHQLIQAGNRDGLARRSVETLIASNPEFAPERAELFAFLRCGAHERFYRTRLGEPAPLAPEQMRPVN